jgi:hypothetical protein
MRLQKHTYTFLRKNFSHTVIIEVPLERGSAQLGLVGTKDPRPDCEYEVLFQLKALSRDVKVDLRECWASSDGSVGSVQKVPWLGPWWAIKSVAYEKHAYPYLAQFRD